MRLGCLLPMVSLAMVIGGAQSVYTAARNRKPVEVGIDSLISRKPDAKWLRITGGVLDTSNSSYVSGITGGDAKNIYVPLVPAGTDSEESTIHILVETRDKELLDFTNQAKKLDTGTLNEKDAGEFILKNLSKLHVARNVEGLVKFGIDSGGKEERKIRKLYDNLAADAIILKEGEKPSMGLGIFMLIGGLGLGGVLVLGASGKKPDPAMPAGPATPPPLPR